MQHRPLPSHLALLSISSHKRAKKPVTQVPLQSPLPPPPLLPLLNFFLGGALVVVVVVVVVDVVVSTRFTGAGMGLPWTGMINSGGVLLPKTVLETQQRRWSSQRPFTLRMASQNPESRSATHTPGHFSNAATKIKSHSCVR